MRTPLSGTERAGEDLSFRTTCGRLIRVGLLTLGGARHPARRISLDVGPSLFYRLHLDLASLSVAEFYPDGNASVARLLVNRLIPAAFPAGGGPTRTLSISAWIPGSAIFSGLACSQSKCLSRTAAAAK